MAKLPKWLEEKRDEASESYKKTYGVDFATGAIPGFNYAWELFTEEARETVEIAAKGEISMETVKKARALKERMGW